MNIGSTLELLSRFRVNPVVPDGQGVIVKHNRVPSLTPIEAIWTGALASAPDHVWQKADQVHVSQATWDRLVEKLKGQEKGSIHGKARPSGPMAVSKSTTWSRP